VPPSEAIAAPAPLIRQPEDAGAPVRADPAALQPNIGATLHEVARLIRRRFERRARQSGLPLTRHQARTLMSIARDEGLSQAAIATLLDIEPIALVRILDRLHEERLVERRPHATDRRIRTLWLTPVGWAVIERVMAINAAVREEACAGLSPAARQALMQALTHLKDNLTLAEERENAAAE
jgi:MarR family transcriptional regulator, transcriptional regulator for hemolysin